MTEAIKYAVFNQNMLVLLNLLAKFLFHGIIELRRVTTSVNEKPLKFSPIVMVFHFF